MQSTCSAHAVAPKKRPSSVLAATSIQRAPFLLLRSLLPSFHRNSMSWTLPASVRYFFRDAIGVVPFKNREWTWAAGMARSAWSWSARSFLKGSLFNLNVTVLPRFYFGKVPVQFRSHCQMKNTEQKQLNCKRSQLKSKRMSTQNVFCTQCIRSEQWTLSWSNCHPVCFQEKRRTQTQLHMLHKNSMSALVQKYTTARPKIHSGTSTVLSPLQFRKVWDPFWTGLKCTCTAPNLSPATAPFKFFSVLLQRAPDTKWSHVARILRGAASNSFLDTTGFGGSCDAWNA